MIVDRNFFVSEVEFVPASPLESESNDAPSVFRSRIVQHFTAVAGTVGLAATLAVFSQADVASAAAMTEPIVVREAIFQTHPSPELTPDIIALYRALADEDVALAEEGMADYARLLAQADDDA